MKVNKKNILALLLLIQILIVKIFAFFPDAIEAIYSQGIYLYIASFSRIVLGWVPFSVGDIIYTIVIIFILYWIWKNKIGFFKNWKSNGLSVLSFLSVLYFLFHFLWGMNYYRKPMMEKLQIEKEYTFEELKGLTQKLIAKTNALQVKISKDSTKKVKFPYTEEEMYNMAPQGFELLPKEVSFIEYQHLSIKSSLFSLPLSYMGFGGYLNPFTNEAQVNDRKPKYTSPLTICHEMTHQTGIASESECNFIGYLASNSHKDIYFQYSANSFALNYCLYNLELMKEGSSKVYKPLINEGVLQNFKESKTFWQQHQTPINDFFEYFYDNFLKMNQQKDGMESYSKFVGLLINYNKKYQQF